MRGERKRRRREKMWPDELARLEFTCDWFVVASHASPLPALFFSLSQPPSLLSLPSPQCLLMPRPPTPPLPSLPSKFLILLFVFLSFLPSSCSFSLPYPVFCFFSLLPFLLSFSFLCLFSFHSFPSHPFFSSSSLLYFVFFFSFPLPFPSLSLSSFYVFPSHSFTCSFSLFILFSIFSPSLSFHSLRS